MFLLKIKNSFRRQKKHVSMAPRTKAAPSPNIDEKIAQTLDALPYEDVIAISHAVVAITRYCKPVEVRLPKRLKESYKALWQIVGKNDIGNLLQYVQKRSEVDGKKLTQDGRNFQRELQKVL